MYQLTDHDGTTSGDVPVPGNALSVDGEFNRLAKILFTFLLVQIPLQDFLERGLRLA